MKRSTWFFFRKQGCTKEGRLWSLVRAASFKRLLVDDVHFLAQDILCWSINSYSYVKLDAISHVAWLLLLLVCKGLPQWFAWYRIWLVFIRVPTDHAIMKPTLPWWYAGCLCTVWLYRPLPADSSDATSMHFHWHILGRFQDNTREQIASVLWDCG